jgi:amidase
VSVGVSLLLAVGLVVSGSAPTSAVPRGQGGVDVDAATIPELQKAMDAHQLTSEALTRFYLDRIRSVDVKLHAVLAVDADAVTQAQASDTRRAQHRLLGPMDGIPVLLKDNIGHGRTTAGSLALVNARPADAFIAGRLHAGGAVILGKTNLSEWANFRSTQSSSGWSAVGGQTGNPYALDHNPCGSSSGSAAAVAADLATVAVGTETDGSIVCPAGVNDLVGLKPSIGRVSRTGLVPISQAQDTAGPLTRNVTDAAVVLTAIDGADQADPPTQAAPDQGDYTRYLDPAALRGARIGIWRAGNTGVSNETDAVLDSTVARLRALGVTVVDPADPAGVGQIRGPEAFALICEFKHNINAYLAATPGDHPRTLAELIAFNDANAAREMPFFGQEIFQVAQTTSGDLNDPACADPRRTATSLARNAIDQTISANHLDAILAPTGNPAWPTDLINGDHSVLGSATPAAVAGYPNITVPAGHAFGLPIGVSFMAGQWAEPRLLALAYAFEQATHARTQPSLRPTAPASDGAGQRSGVPNTTPGQLKKPNSIVPGQVRQPNGATY